jgi:hypothetical protein
MFSLVPDVHLFVCLDPRVAPGPVLHGLDLARTLHWKSETVLLCDESWRSYVNVDQPVLFIDRKKILNGHHNLDTESLEILLEQLDHFEIEKITQLGELSWARWIEAYFQEEQLGPIHKINWEQSSLSSLQVMNDLINELALETEVTKPPATSAVYIDPYEGDDLSPSFLDMLDPELTKHLPSWLCFIVKDKDKTLFQEYGLEDNTVECDDVQMTLFNQSVLCFSELSPLAQTSRSYRVAYFGKQSQKALFVPGDMKVEPKDSLHFLELCQLLSYWRAGRLKELAFQWFTMNVEIQMVESFHGRLTLRNLMNYSSDLFHCQMIIQEFMNQDSQRTQSMESLIRKMRKLVNNDPFALSFSLKILLMIVERMMISAECGERLFLRLGSDYHRIIIGEALIEGLIEEGQWPLDIKSHLKSFYQYLNKMDHLNDQLEEHQRMKEPA